ncbi:MAG: hypothetical protein ABIA47_01850 [bacterium]
MGEVFYCDPRASRPPSTQYPDGWAGWNFVVLDVAYCAMPLRVWHEINGLLSYGTFGYPELLAKAELPIGATEGFRVRWSETPDESIEFVRFADGCIGASSTLYIPIGEFTFRGGYPGPDANRAFDIAIEYLLLN